MIGIRETPATRDKLLAFGFGVTFVAVMIAVAVLIPEPTPFSYTVFRIVLALAAAGVGAVLPGFLEVSFRNVLRASGAVALFVVVYFFSPVALSEPNDGPALPPLPQIAGRAVAEQWLRRFDSGDYPGAYREMSTAFRSRYPVSDFTEAANETRSPLGRLISRRFHTSRYATTPPGAPPGHYQLYQFRSRFENEPRPLYESVSLEAEGGMWRVDSIYLYSRNEDGQLIPYELPDPE